MNPIPTDTRHTFLHFSLQRTHVLCDSSSNKLFSILVYIERRALVEVESLFFFFSSSLFLLFFWQGRCFLLQVLPSSLCISLNGMMVSLGISAHLKKCLDNVLRKMVWLLSGPFQLRILKDSMKLMMLSISFLNIRVLINNFKKNWSHKEFSLHENLGLPHSCRSFSVN